MGYEYGMTNSRIPHGDLRKTNAVWISLPASLSEITLVDTMSSEKDAGLSLPVLNPPRTSDGRWQVEGFIPAFATDLLRPTFTPALSKVPSVTAIVIRAGFLIAYGMRAHDASTIGPVADSLAALIDAVPSGAWGRSDILVAGLGVFPRRTVGGAELRLEQRLVRPDWKGYGLGGKVQWRQASDALKHVTMSRREAVDVWDVPPGTPSGIYIGTQAGGSDVPTVASAPHHGV